MTTNDPQNRKIKIVGQNRRETNFEKALFEIGFSYDFGLRFCLRFHLRTHCPITMASALVPPTDVDIVLRPDQSHPALHMIAVDGCANWFEVIRYRYGVPAV